MIKAPAPGRMLLVCLPASGFGFAGVGEGVTVATRSRAFVLRGPISFFFLSVGSYPTFFLGFLLFYITDPSHKTRYPKQGVGYETLGLGNIPQNPFLIVKAVVICF